MRDRLLRTKIRGDDISEARIAGLGVPGPGHLLGENFLENKKRFPVVFHHA
jgi:hypothetical protein